MVTVVKTERKSAVLTPSSLACLSRVPTVNLTAGCALACIYCYTLGYASHPGEGKIVIYENTLEKLKAELGRKRTRPRSVFFSSASDLFQPVPEVLELGYHILEFLFSRDIGVAFLTKGRIPDEHMDLLLRNSLAVRAQIGIITLDEEVAHTFEPNAPGPHVRLDQMRALTAGGIATEPRLDPILPGLTDGPGVLRPLFSALADAGVKRAAAGTLFLRPAISESLKRSLADRQVSQDLFRFYGIGRNLAIRAERSSIVALPQAHRSQILERVTQTAEEQGITVSVCACKNPDLARGTCNIGGKWPQQLRGAARPSLFGMEV